MTALFTRKPSLEEQLIEWQKQEIDLVEIGFSNSHRDSCSGGYRVEYVVLRSKAGFIKSPSFGETENYKHHRQFIVDATTIMEKQSMRYYWDESTEKLI